MTEIKTLNFKFIIAMVLFLNVYILKTLIKFNKFLSEPITIRSINGTHFNGTLTGEKVHFSSPDWLHPLALNIFLIELFYIQHSLLKTPVEKVLQQCGLDFLERSVFNLLSALVLQIMMHFWHPITYWALWNVHMEPYSWTDWTLWCIRLLTWLALLCECLLLDISDLIGWRQIVHHFKGQPPPCVYRSANFNLTLSDMRHPGLLEILVLVWATPTLTLDRLACSALLSAYVVLGFRGQCAAYVTQQRQKKLRELAAPSIQCSPSKRVHFKLPPDINK